MKKADIALIGLAVMGENLVLNMESRGFTVAVFNRTVEKLFQRTSSPAILWKSLQTLYLNPGRSC